MTGLPGGAVDADLVVAGGGPVGLAAAIEARLAGMSVIVVEPRSAPVDKACGEGLMPGAVRALHRLGVEPVGRPFRGIRYVDAERVVEHRFPDLPGLGVRRLALHAALHARAAELGVREVRGQVSEIRSADLAVVAGGVRAHWLLACDGLHSAVRRRLGLEVDPGRIRRYGLRQHFHVVPWSDLVEVYWGRVHEAYVTPVADDLLGVALLGPPGRTFAEALADIPHLAARLAGTPAASRVLGAGPLRQSTSRRVSGRVLLVGDAGGYVDALTGEGLAVGLAQARAAVRAVAAGRPETYEQSWRHVTRHYRLLTAALLSAATRPRLRRMIVPAAARLPKVFGAAVESLAR